MTDLLTLAESISESWDSSPPAEIGRLARLLGQRSDYLAGFEPRLKGVTTREGFEPFLVAIRRETGRTSKLCTDRPTGIRTFPMTIVVDNVRSAHNVGSIFRTAEALGVREIILSGYTPTPRNEKVTRVSMGTEAWMTWEHVPTPEECLEKLRQRRLRIYIAEVTATAKPVDQLDLTAPCALVIGNERHGVSQEFLREGHEFVQIPLYGRKHSLNVSVACGILTYEMTRKLGQHGI